MKKLPALERYAPAVVGVLLALPVLVARYPPMTDLPLHEAVVAILRHFDDAEMFPAGLYAKNLGEPNQLFHLVAWLLSYAVPTDLACKIVVALSVFAIPVAGARFAKYVGASPLSALALAPIALGWTFTWGLVANLIGISALLALLPWLDRNAETPSGRSLAFALLAVPVLYFAHEQMLLIYGAAAVLLVVVHPFAPKKTALRIAPVIVIVAVVLAQAEYQKRFIAPLAVVRPTEFASLGYKLEHTPEMFIRTTDAPVAVLFMVLVFAALAGLFALRWRERKEDPTRRERLLLSWPSSIRPRLHRYRFELLALGLLLLYLAFPFRLNGATLVYHRFFAPAFAVAVVIAAPRDLTVSRARLARYLLPVLPLGTLLLTWPSFVDSDRSYRKLDRVLALMEPGSAVATLELSKERRDSDLSAASASTRTLAVKGGRVLYSFTDSPIAACVMEPEYQWLEVATRTSSDSLAFRPAEDLTRFRYVLFRSNEPWVIDDILEAFEPYARFLGPRTDAGARDRDCEWVLLESRSPTIPLLSPDTILPTEPDERRRVLESWGPTLKTLLLEVIRRHPERPRQ